jgi:hypothetical protein
MRYATGLSTHRAPGTFIATDGQRVAALGAIGSRRERWLKGEAASSVEDAAGTRRCGASEARKEPGAAALLGAATARRVVTRAGPI